MSTQPLAERQRFLDGARAAVHQARRHGVSAARPGSVELAQHTSEFTAGYEKAWSTLLTPLEGLAAPAVREGLDRAEATINS